MSDVDGASGLGPRASGAARAVLLVVAGLAGACTKKPADHAEPVATRPAGDAAAAPGAPRVDAAIAVAPEAAAPPVKPAACGVVDEVLGLVRRAYLAMNAHAPEQQALALWPTVPAACRNGRWYLAAAMLLELGNQVLEAGDVKLADEAAALGAALRQPDDQDVLVRVAFVAGRGRPPGLPADACARARKLIAPPSEAARKDRAAYVCARAALAAGDAAEARAQLDAIADPRAFADLALARAEAAKLAGDAKRARDEARKVGKRDFALVGGNPIPFRDLAAIAARAREIATGK